MQPKVMMAIPSYKLVPAVSFHRMMMSLLENQQKRLITWVGMKTHLYVTQARNELAEEAVKAYKDGKVTHIWFLDDDMMPLEGTLEKLLSHDLPVVSGLYYGRDLRPIMYELEPFRIMERNEVQEHGLQQVDGVGFGCILIRADVLQAMTINYGAHLFQTPVRYDEEKDRTGEVGEDVYFCELLADMGVPVYVDVDLDVPHIAQMGINRTLAEVVDYNNGVFVKEKV